MNNLALLGLRLVGVTIITAATAALDAQAPQNPASAIQPQGAVPTTFRVHGKVTGVPADAPAGLFRVSLAPTTFTPQGAIHLGIQPDGTFSFQVPRGTYTLVTSPPNTGAGLRRVEVVDRDVEIPEARLQFSLWGQIVMDDGSPIPVRERTLRSWSPSSFVSMRTAVVSGPPRRDPAGFTAAGPNGMFTLDLPPGQYSISLLRLPLGYSVKSMTQGSIDLLKGAAFTIADVTKPVEVRMVLTAKVPEGAAWRKISGRVDGFVRGTSSRVALAPVLQFGSGPGTVVEEREGEARVREDGTFELANVPQGEYTLRYDPDPTGGRTISGRMIQLTVGDSDMSGVSVPAAP